MRIQKVIRRVRTWLRPRLFSRELDEELRFHLDMQARWHESQGIDPTTARTLAAREFGGATRFREAVLDTRGLSWSHDLGRDVRFALRSFRRSPGFTAVALVTLALGIGTTTAAFSIIDAVLLRPLPYRDPGRIVTITGRDSLGHDIQSVSVPTYYDWREQTRSFETMALYSSARRGVTGAGEAANVETATVSGEFFRVLQLDAERGRVLTTADAGADAPVAVVSHGFWVRALGGDSAPILPDTAIRVGSVPYRIVGVLPAQREFPAGTDLFLPSSFDAPWRTASRNNINFRLIARLAPGVSLDRARGEMRTIGLRVHAAHPDDLYAHSAGVTALQERLVGPSRLYLELLGGAVALVLLVACVNLANANLARGAVRAREIAIRTTLGAGRMRLVRQLLVESVTLSVVGAVGGVVLAWALVRVVARTAAIGLPRAGEIEVNGAALAFAMGLAIVVGIVVGLAPVFQVARSALASAVGAGGRSTATRSRVLLRDLLIGLELVLAIVLLVGAGLLVRSFDVVVSRDVGFHADGAVTAELSLPPATYAGRRAIAFYDRLFPALRALPGVSAVGATNFLPLGTGATGFIEVEGQTTAGAGAGYRVVTDDYFSAMGIPLLGGRFFTAQDDSGTTRVTLVNRAMAERFWPGQDPIGRRFKATSMEWNDPPWLTVVGVVGNVRHWGLEQDAPVEHYVLYRQRPDYARVMAVVVRGTGATGPLLRAVREQIRAVDRDVPVDLSTLRARVDQSLAERRFIMSVLTSFSMLALLLAAVGVYGVLSFSVAQRTREMAVRLALGADRSRVLALVVGRVVRVTVLAVGVGLVVARATSGVLQALLFEVSPADPGTYGLVSVLLGLVALLAAYVPARRAANVDPMVVLRGE